MIFYVFCDAVDFVFGLMDSDLGIGSGNGIDLAGDLLFFEDWSFSDVDSKFGFASGLVGGYNFLFELTFFDH